jgi:hypothetical protein
VLWWNKFEWCTFCGGVLSRAGRPRNRDSILSRRKRFYFLSTEFSSPDIPCLLPVDNWVLYAEINRIDCEADHLPPSAGCSKFIVTECTENTSLHKQVTPFSWAGKNVRIFVSTYMVDILRIRGLTIKFANSSR